MSGEVSKRYRPTVAIVDLVRLAQNFRVLKSTVADDTFVCPMVKANAYGHGDVAIANKLRRLGAQNLGVGLIEEGVRLRENRDSGTILHFGMFGSSDAEVMIENRLSPVLSSRQGLEDFATAAARFRSQGHINMPLEVHVKINTGMNRLGISCDEVADFSKRLVEVISRGDLRLVGLSTHFSEGEDFGVPGGESEQQLRKFYRVETEMRAAGLHGFQLHVANSSAAAGIARHRDSNRAYAKLGIRPGLALYGVEPHSKENIQLGVEPVLQLVSRITHIQNVRTGEGVSYGLNWRAGRPSRIGVIPCGYADGFRRCITDGMVIAGGKRIPVVGTVCMDYIMCDLTEVESVKLNDEVTLIGSVDAVSIKVDELAQSAQTIPYEIFTGISERVPRLYVDDEAPVSVPF